MVMRVVCETNKIQSQSRTNRGGVVLFDGFGLDLVDHLSIRTCVRETEVRILCDERTKEIVISPHTALHQT